MTRYQLAKLVEWAGKLRTRKRLQKVAYLLQAAGCPLDADFTLHHFGPYSSDVAGRTDEMTTLGLLQEECVGNGSGKQYNYSLTEDAKARLAALEGTPQGQTWAQDLTPYEARARKLLGTDVRDLEVAATIVYFLNQGRSWTDSVERTCVFKGLKSEDPLVLRAAELARGIRPEEITAHGAQNLP